MYRGLKLWESAVREAGTLDQDAVISALDHARLADGPGGPTAMVAGQHHLRLNMYIAQVRNGALDVVKNLGPIDPKEEVVGALAP
jgi:branched-chain amino acid transport system substrate-binding protein